MQKMVHQQNFAKPNLIYGNATSSFEQNFTGGSEDIWKNSQLTSNQTSTTSNSTLRMPTGQYNNVYQSQQQSVCFTFFNFLNI